VALDGHIDGLGIPILLAGILLAERRRDIASAVLVGVAGLTKLYPLFLVPFLGRRAGWRALRYAGIVGVVVAAGYLLYAESTGGVVDSLLVYGTTFEFNGAVYPLLKSLTGSAFAGHIVSGLLFLIWILILFLRRLPLVESALFAFAGFLLLSPTVHPWYFTWIAALLPLCWSLPLFVLLGLTGLSNFVVYRYRTTGVWEEQPLLVVLEYVPFLILVLYERFRRPDAEEESGE
jgi:hypothetical protein